MEDTVQDTEDKRPGKKPGETNADYNSRMKDARGGRAAVDVDPETGKAKPLKEYDPTKSKDPAQGVKTMPLLKKDEPPKQDPGEGVLAYKKRMDAWNKAQEAKAAGQKKAMAE